MNPSVACFASNCTNPVIGQCAGYKGSCGRFYCTAHSIGKLCSECIACKSQDDIVEDYIKTAKKIEKDTGWEAADHYFSLLGIISLSLLILPVLVMSWIDTVIPIPSTLRVTIFVVGFLTGGFVLPLLGLVRITTRKQQIEEMKVHEASQAKPQFAEFFKAWKQEKQKERLMKGLAIAGIILAGAAAAAVSSSEKSREEESIRNAVDHELRRHDL